jgi:putative hydrolase of the HAD superfamily
LYERAVEALRNKNIAPANALYVGNDMLNDIYPAQQAGFQTALFAGDRHSLRLRENDLRCRSLSPDLFIIDLRDLIRNVL